jgi:hypothetical protein
MTEQKNLINFNIVKKIITNIQNRVATQHETYCDPRTGDKFQMYREQLKNVFVFVAGGGSYYEYECMHKLEEETKVQIIYGSDYIFHPDEFLQELQKLNNK